jgi:nickel transport protein
MNPITINYNMIFFYCCMVLFGLLWLEKAQAHRLKLFANSQGFEIKGSVYFSGGISVKDISVAIYLKEKKIAVVTTDTQGQFSYLASESGEYELVASDGSGHRARFRITVTDATASAPAFPSVSPPTQLENTDDFFGNTKRDHCTDDINLTHWEAALQPLHSQLFELQKQLTDYEAKIRWHDIIGGLGYIFGLAGLWLWWRTR